MSDYYTNLRLFNVPEKRLGVSWYEDTTYSPDCRNNCMTLRSGRMLPHSKEETEEAIKSRSFGYDSESEENDDDVHFPAFDLFGPVVYERVRVEGYDNYDDEDEEYMTDDFKEFLEERGSIERNFDFAQIRNRLRAYVCDSYTYGYLERQQLLDIIARFNEHIGSIKKKNLSLAEYGKICEKKFRRVLGYELNKRTISLRSFKDIMLRLRKIRGRDNNTFVRNKEKYFGEDDSESHTETMVEETTETTKKIETKETIGDTETTETIEKTVSVKVTKEY